MQQLYQEAVNGNLTNLTLWQHGYPNEALRAFRDLTQQVNSQMEKTNRDLASATLGPDESLLLDELNKLRAEIEENSIVLESEWAKLQQQQQRLAPKAQSQSQSQTQSNSQSQLKQKTQTSQQSLNRPMKKSLRHGGLITASSSNNVGKQSNSISSDSAKKAANMIWAPSHSLGTQKSNSLTSNSSNEIFAGFDTEPSDKDNYRENQTLMPQHAVIYKSTLSSSPISPYDSADEEIVDQIIQLKLQKSSKHLQSSRTKAALQASSKVRFPSRPNTNKTQQPNSRSQRGNNSSVSTVKVKVKGKAPQNRPRADSPSKVPVLSGGSTIKDRKDFSTDDDIDDNDEAIIKSLNINPDMGRQILNDMNSNDDEVHWDDIAGLEGAKQALKEAVVWPLLRPDLFTGLREPPNGMLLFGPPGTGKTMLAKAAATESGSNFFSIQASSITSKFLGESEKLVKALFQIAKLKAPSIIFVDEIDSLMGQRSESGENDSMRRVKNEFLVQWSGLTKSAGRGDSSRVLVLAATNLPWAIDDAARRRFVKRQYIPLPESSTRAAQFDRLLGDAHHGLSKEDMLELVAITDGYSGSDIDSLAKDAAMAVTRGLSWEEMMDVNLKVRQIELNDFKQSMKLIKPSVGKDGLQKFEKWVKEYGSSGA